MDAKTRRHCAGQDENGFRGSHPRNPASGNAGILTVMEAADTVPACGDAIVYAFTIDKMTPTAWKDERSLRKVTLNVSSSL